MTELFKRRLFERLLQQFSQQILKSHIRTMAAELKNILEVRWVVFVHNLYAGDKEKEKVRVVLTFFGLKTYI
jgi:hypothetical protein